MELGKSKEEKGTPGSWGEIDDLCVFPYSIFLFPYSSFLITGYSESVLNLKNYCNEINR